MHDSDQSNKSKINKIYYESNKDWINPKKKEYYEKNKDIMRLKKKEYYEKNKEAIIARVTEYQKNNKEKRNAKRRAAYAMKKQLNDG